jgi:hypothetical protein
MIYLKQCNKDSALTRIRKHMKENGKEYYDEIVKKKICYEKKRKAK